METAIMICTVLCALSVFTTAMNYHIFNRTQEYNDKSIKIMHEYGQKVIDTVSKYARLICRDTQEDSDNATGSKTS